MATVRTDHMSGIESIIQLRPHISQAEAADCLLHILPQIATASPKPVED